MSEAEAIAFYLPQYHPIAENDAHWGRGFTEWFNVVRAKPLYPQHYQPHLPADLGFYDLRIPEVRAQQRELAQGAGIRAFALYHYWLGGKRLMGRPVDDFFDDAGEDFRYLLCWANESWTLQWRGRDDWTTIEQTYSPEDDERHAEFLAQRFFRRPNYFRLDDRAVFVVYNPHHLPEPRRTTEVLRAAARAVGVELTLGAAVAFEEAQDPRTIGFDFALRWAPNWLLIRDALDRRLTVLLRAEAKLLGRRARRFRGNEAYDYPSVSQAHLVPKREWPTCETAFPSWDNTARRAHGDAIVIQNLHAGPFASWLNAAVHRLRPGDPGLVFINAWNEWAEGCHLEPCSRLGHQWLDVCARCFNYSASER